MVEAGGRVVRYKHTLYDWLKVNKVELAVDRRAAPPGLADRGRPPGPGQPDGAPARPRRAPGGPRIARRQGPGRLPLPARASAGAWSSPTTSTRPTSWSASGPARPTPPPADDEPERPARPVAARPESAPAASPAELAALRAELGELREAGPDASRRGPGAEIGARGLTDRPADPPIRSPGKGPEPMETTRTEPDEPADRPSPAVARSGSSRCSPTTARSRPPA